MSETTNGTKDQFADIPPNIKEVIFQFLLGVHNENVDVSVPRLRESFNKLFYFVVFIYGLLIIIGVLGNTAVSYHILRHRLYKDPTYLFLLNNVISDILKCVFILPISLYVLMVQNWMLGEILCTFLPMIQDIPLHATTLCFLLIAWDRFLFVRNPNKERLPAFVCAVGIWLTALCLVLPYPIYIMYIDLGKYIPSLDGIGICIVNLIDDLLEYMRVIFLFMYAAPFSTISYLYVKVSRQIQTEQEDLGVILYETRRGGRSRNGSHSTTTDLRSARGESDNFSQHSRTSHRLSHGSVRERSIRRESSDELDTAKEKRNQKYLVLMVTLYGACICPLMVLRVARLALIETYDNAAHLDLTYTLIVWIAFLPTCTTPAVFAFWQMSRSSKERLRGYFRVSSLKLGQSRETVVTTGGTATVPKAVCTLWHKGDPRGQSHRRENEEGQSRVGSQQEFLSP